MRAVAGQPATERVQFATDDGNNLIPDAAPSLTILSGDRVTVILPPTPGVADASLGDGAYKVVFAAPAQLDTLTATWTATVGGLPMTVTDVITVVGQRLVSPFRLRANSPDLAGLSPVSLLTLLDQVEDLITDVLGFSPVLEGARPVWDTMRGTLTDSAYAASVSGIPLGAGGGRQLIPGIRMPVPKAPGGVWAGAVNGIAMTPTDLAAIDAIDGALVWSDYRPWISGRYALWLAHGITNPPGDLRDAAARLCNYYGKTAVYPERASQVTTEGATIWFALPSSDRPTGIPEIDGVLNRRSLSRVL